VKFNTITRSFSATIDGKPLDIREVYIEQRDKARPSSRVHSLGQCGTTGRRR